MDNGYRLVTAMLEHAPSATAQDVCMKTPATIDGAAVPPPRRCRNMCGNMRGEFVVPDAACEANGPAVTDPIRRVHDRINGCSKARLIQQARTSLEEFAGRIKGGAKLREFSDPELQQAADECGFRSMTLTTSGDASFIVGANLATGFAFGVNDCSEPRGIASVGVTAGTSMSIDGGLQVGFWEATVDGLAGFSKGYTAGAGFGLGMQVSAFFDQEKPPAFQGLTVGLGTGIGVEGEKGVVLTKYTDTLDDFAGDAARVLTGRATLHGADLGGKCTLDTDCKGYRVRVGWKGGVACCSHRCAETRRFLFVWRCP